LALERCAAAADAGGAGTHLGRVEAALALLQAEIAAVLVRDWGQASAPRQPGPGDLGELRQLLAQSDSRALDWWQAHGAHSGLSADTRHRLDEALAALDFDTAAGVLKDAA